MKAIRVHRFGLEHPMQLDEMADPKPLDSEIVVQTGAIGAHPVDVVIRAAKHPFHKNFTPPYIPGPEAAGVVVAVAPGVKTFRVGQRVCGRCNGGSYAEKVRMSTSWAMELPESYSDAEGAGIVVQFATAWNALVIQAQAGPGETVLIHGGAGGVGMAALQLARTAGCRVFATAGSKEKCTLCLELGAEQAINYREQNFADSALRLTEGRGVDVVVDCAADANLMNDVEAIRPGGRIIVLGTAKALDEKASFGVQRALVKDARILCMSMPNLAPHLPDLMRRLSSLVSKTHFMVPIYREMKLAEANTAHELLWSGEHHGKVVLVP